MKQSTLIYNGIQYFITVKIFSTSSTTEYDNIDLKNFDVLLYDNIKKIEYENDISNSLLTGEIIYQDNSNSIMNKFLSISNRYVNVSIKKLKNSNKVSLNDILEESSYDTSFNHTFLINDIIKIKQDNDIITYSLKLISSHWWNFNCNLLYSTHSNPSMKDSPIAILKHLYTLAGFTLYDNNISTNNQISFISDTDECLQTAQAYLLKRTYSRDTLEAPGLIKVVYDYITNRYNLWSLRDHSGDSYISASYSNLNAEELFRNIITIPIYNSYMDVLENQDPTTFKIINFDTQENMYSKTFDYVYWTFDYSTNSFVKKNSVTNKNIIESLPYVKNKPLEYDKKYYEISNMISKKNKKGTYIYNRESSEWSEHYWPYDDIDDLFLNTNIVSVNTAGNMLRKSGDNTFLQIDKSDNSSLLNLNGDWINTRVVHTFTDTKYRNTVLLSRINVTLNNIREEIHEKL